MDKREELIASILYQMSLSVDSDAAIKIMDHKVRSGNTILEEVIEDVQTSSDWENNYHYNDDDIRLAIGRVLMANLGIEV